MEELSYSPKQRKEAEQDKIPEKLHELRNNLPKEPKFFDYNFSGLDKSRSSDICFWLFVRFSETIGIQIKHQLKTPKIVIILRPIKYNRSLNEPFTKIMNKKDIEVKNPTGEPYVGIQQTPIAVPNYKQGILREDYQEINSQLISTIEWIKAIK